MPNNTDGHKNAELINKLTQNVPKIQIKIGLFF